MNAKPQLAAVLEQLSRIVAQPDTICTTERGLRALEARAKPANDATMFFGGPSRFAGMMVRVYPVGTVITERRTGKTHTVEEGWFFTCFFDDVTIQEPAS